uniref:Uncharacterized protein n=1 Tax=Panagrolaimus superbus TaxID=310955 RepID=A0A914YDA7_9BILA
MGKEKIFFRSAYLREKCEFAISVTSCTPFTCRNGAECHVLNNHPICRYCQWPKPDADDNCRLRSISFGGNGYVVIPKIPERYEWEASLDIATISSIGIILYAGDKRKGDFLELSLENGVPKVEMSLGGESKILLKAADWPENRVNNGEWHTIKLKYHENRLRLAIDDCDDHLSITMSRKIGYKHCAVEATFELPLRCIDPAVPCHRSFDLQSTIILGSRPSSHNINSKQNQGFTGCIRDFYLNKKFLDFSDFKSLERFGDVVAGCQRYRPDKCEYEKPCDGESKCLDKWLGHLCQCNHRNEMKAPSCHLETASALSLFSEEAYASWRLPANIRYPLTLFFEFRTRERKTQVLALEFELKSQMFIFSVENGHGLVQIDAEQYFIPFPQLSDAQWHSVEVHFTTKKVEIAIDKYYQKEFKFVSENLLSIPQQLYSGQAPSTSYPHVFLGCIRNVELNKIKLKPLETSQTRPSCQIPNACTSETKICPKSSTCVRDWDRHNCVCNKGYSGDSCVDICSIEGICRNEGLCIRSNSTRGYDCLCPDGFKGPNCERKNLPKVCPPGWFGIFPNCQKCICQTRRGFKHYCDRASGQCICQPGTYQYKGHCKPCECGYGSSSALCDAVTGQCPCSGESSGRRCDRCRLTLSFLDKKTLKCVKIKDRCTSEIEEGVQWPSTLRGVVARQSCPGNQMGIATRKCSNEGEWQTVYDYNCTLPQLYDLNAKIVGKFDAFDVGRQLLNFTSDFAFVKNRNIDLAINVFEKVVVTEAKNSLTVSRQHSRHVRDSQFTKNIVEIINALLDYKLNEIQFQQLMVIMYDYGVLLTSVHEAALYLKPFQVVRQNLLFAIDKLDSRKYPSNSFNLPKYDQFAPPEPEMERALVDSPLINFYHSHKVNLIGPENFVTSTAFYSIISKAHCQGCEHSLILVSHLTAAEPELHPEIIQITFKSDDGMGWRLPECVWLNFESDLLAQHGLMASKEYGVMEKLSNVFKTDWSKAENTKLQWRSDHAVLIGLNSTHITCQYHLVAGGIFTVLVKSDGNAIQFSLYSGGMPLTSPLLTAFSLLLCIGSLLLVLLRRHVKIRFIRVLIILAFIFNATILFTTQKITMSTSFCAFRNASLTLAISLLFSWLFIYSLHIYHLLAEGHPTPCISICILIGLLLPTALSAANFFILPTCSLTTTSPALWLMLSPMVIFILLNFYALATSFLISLSKQYDIVASKFSLKRTLLTHTLLTLCCSIYNGMAIYFFVIGRQTTYPEIFSNIILFIASGVLCFSSTMMTYNESEKQKIDKSSLWNNQTFSPTDPTATLPLLEASKKQNDRIYDGPPGEWMPDVIPSETYVHHTLQRSLQLGAPLTPIRRTPPQVPQILSPAQKVFGPLGSHGSSSFSIDDGTRSTLPRELLTTPTSATRRLFFSGSATVSRSGSLASHSTMPSTQHGNKFSIAQMDQMDDAYYTYSSSSRFQTTSTFR